jgi:preprotein translocase subunit SecF
MNIIGKTKIWFGISILTIVIGLIALGAYRLKPSIDFAGGSLLEITIPEKTVTTDLQPIFEQNGFKQLTLTRVGQGSLLSRSEPVNQDQKNKAVDEIKKKAGEGVVEKKFETIGPTVSAHLLKNAILSVVLASLGIILYIAFAFRRLPDRQLSWRFGLTAIIALLHDLLFTVGIFALVAHFMGWEVDTLFITALLTVMGFSVHDTIVVFDRLRENLQQHPGADFDTTVNASVVQTLARSLNTSLTILITLGTLLVLGGEALRPFVFTLFVGIFVGTYSSIFVASPLVAVWQKMIDRRGSKK